MGPHLHQEQEEADGVDVYMEEVDMVVVYIKEVDIRPFQEKIVLWILDMRGIANCCMSEKL